MRYLPVIIFTILGGAAGLQAWQMGQGLGFFGNSEQIARQGSFLVEGKSLTGYEYLGALADYLASEATGDASLFVLGTDAEPGHWLSYLAYPRLIRYLPLDRHARKRIQRISQRHFFVVIMPPDSSRPWKGDALELLMKTLDPEGGFKQVHADRFGAQVFEVRR
jgi:hypothetical protein